MLAAYVVGSGEPIVFLHANVCDSRMWSTQLDAIGATHKAIAYDRRGFGETRFESEDFSAAADLVAVINALTNGEQVILVGCSQGGKIALDAALQFPSLVRALVLMAPSVDGAPDPVYSPEVKELFARQKSAEDARDLDRANSIKARLWLDGPLAPEGRVAGTARELFLDMNAVALRAPPIGSSLDAPPAFPHLGEIEVPALVIWGNLDFPHIQERCRRLVTMMPNASGHELTGTAHLPSLDRPADITDLVAAFVGRCSAGSGPPR